MEVEKHERQFRGWWTPVEIVDLFDNGIINPIEVILLNTIDSFCRSGQGCFASNAYLAKKLHRSENRITIIISKLKRLGLIKQISFDGRRRALITCWSEWYKTEPVRKVKASLCETAQAPHSETHSILYKGIREGYKNLNSSNSYGRLGGVHTRGLILDSELINNHAKKMLAILSAHNCDSFAFTKGGKTFRRQTTVRALAKRFETIHLDKSIDTAEIDNVLEWLEDNYGKTYTPKIYKLDDIVTKWKKFEDAMHRSQDEGGNENGLPSMMNSKGAFKAVFKIRNWLTEHGCDCGIGDIVDLKDINRACKALGIKKGTFDPDEV